jgi:predicted metal-dependent RNase
VQVDDELEIKPYYAGHVLGAAMFHIRVGSQSVVYTVSFRFSLMLEVLDFYIRIKLELLSSMN